MKILYLGSVIKTDDCTKYVGPSVAGNKMQIGILKGLSKICENISVVTEIPIAAFPKEKLLFVNPGQIELTNDIEAKAVPFINIFVLKQMMMINSAFWILLKWCVKNMGKKKVIVTYNAFPYISIPTMLVSKIFKVKTVCIFADPPIDVVSRNIFGKIAKYFEDKSTEKNIKKYDGLVVLNERAVERYSSNAIYTLIDGGFDIVDEPENKPGGQWLKHTENDVVNIVFSGALYEYNGLVNLIEGFKIVKNMNLRLNIYGSGPLSGYVETASNQDHRIVYQGNVPNDEMITIQQNASFLINPRPIDEQISQYTFPSKMIEYMLSGTPVITTKLNGLTAEYLKNVFVLEDNSINEIKNCIERVTRLDKEYLIDMSCKARKFIIDNKSWDIQSRKIYDFITNTVSR